MMTVLVPVKPPDVARHDRDIGGVAAFVLFGAFVLAMFFGVRFVRRRALEDRADRELREAIDEISRKEIR